MVDASSNEDQRFSRCNQPIAQALKSSSSHGDKCESRSLYPMVVCPNARESRLNNMQKIWMTCVLLFSSFDAWQDDDFHGLVCIVYCS